MEDDDEKDALLLQSLLEPPQPGFDEVMLVTFLQSVEEVGHIQDACAECHVTEEQLVEALEADPSLKEEMEIRQGRYRANLRRRFTSLAMEGYEVKLIGGKDKDQVIDTQMVPDQKAMDIVSRMVFSQDMAAYTRQLIIQEDNRKRKDQEVVLDKSKLTRQQRKEMDALLDKMVTHIEVVDQKENK